MRYQINMEPTKAWFTYFIKNLTYFLKMKPLKFKEMK